MCDQSRPALCGGMRCSPPGPSVHGISQARIPDGLPFPAPEHCLSPGIEPMPPALASGLLTTGAAKELMKRCFHLSVWQS